MRLDQLDQHLLKNPLSQASIQRASGVFPESLINCDFFPIRGKINLSAAELAAAAAEAVLKNLPQKRLRIALDIAPLAM